MPFELPNRSTSQLCPFCTQNDIRERVIIWNSYAWAFPTHTPIVPGHILICPVRCVPRMDDLTTEELLSLLQLQAALKPALKEVFQAEGFNFAWNESRVAGQTVPHLHLHVVPRRKGDTGIHDYEPRRYLYRPGSREPSTDAQLKGVTYSIQRWLASKSPDYDPSVDSGGNVRSRLSNNLSI